MDPAYVISLWLLLQVTHDQSNVTRVMEPRTEVTYIVVLYLFSLMHTSMAHGVLFQTSSCADSGIQISSTHTSPKSECAIHLMKLLPSQQLSLGTVLGLSVALYYLESCTCVSPHCLHGALTVVSHKNVQYNIKKPICSAPFENTETLITV